MSGERSEVVGCASSSRAGAARPVDGSSATCATTATTSSTSTCAHDGSPHGQCIRADLTDLGQAHRRDRRCRRGRPPRGDPRARAAPGRRDVPDRTPCPRTTSSRRPSRTGVGPRRVGVERDRPRPAVRPDAAGVRARSTSRSSPPGELVLALQARRRDDGRRSSPGGPAIPFVGLRISNIMEPPDYAAFPGYQDDPRLRRGTCGAMSTCATLPRRSGRRSTADVHGAEVCIVAAADTVMRRPSATLMAEVFPGVPLRHPVPDRADAAVDRPRRAGARLAPRAQLARRARHRQGGTPPDDRHRLRPVRRPDVRLLRHAHRLGDRHLARRCAPILDAARRRASTTTRCSRRTPATRPPLEAGPVPALPRGPRAGRPAASRPDSGVTPTDEELAAFGGSVGDWPAFDDSADALAPAQEALPPRRHHELRRRPVRGLEPAARRRLRLGRSPRSRCSRYKPNHRNFDAAFAAHRRAARADPPRRPEPVPRPRAGQGARADDRLDRPAPRPAGLRGDPARRAATPDLIAPDMATFADVALGGAARPAGAMR